MKKSGLYTKYKRMHDRTSPYTNTYVYTYHHLLTTFNEQSKQVSSKLRLVFRIIHSSYPGEGRGYHDFFLAFSSLSWEKPVWYHETREGFISSLPI